MTYPIEEVREALDKLGSTPDEIAATLANKGIKGCKQKLHSLGPGQSIQNLDPCPLVNYLNEQGFGVTGIGPTNVWWGDEAFPHNRPAIHEFIHRFDHGGYPELVEEVS